MDEPKVVDASSLFAFSGFVSRLFGSILSSFPDTLLDDVSAAFCSLSAALYVIITQTNFK